MHWLLIFFIVSTFFWQVTNPECAIAKDNKVEVIKQCASYIEDSAATLRTQDWFHLERLSKKSIENCKDVVDSKGYSEFYQNLAIAKIEQNYTMDALAACEKCIDFYYKNSGCHLLKVRVLILLRKISEARTEIKITEKLLDYHITETEKFLRDTNEKTKKEWYIFRLNDLNVQKKMLNLEKNKLADARRSNFD